MASGDSEAMAPLCLIGVIGGVTVMLGSIAYGGALGIRRLVTKDR
jgi:hypothetical protein